MMATKDRPKIDRSQTFDDFLAEQGMLEDAEEQAIKEIIADQIREAMGGQGLSKTAMAARMSAVPMPRPCSSRRAPTGPMTSMGRWPLPPSASRR